MLKSSIIASRFKTLSFTRNVSDIRNVVIVGSGTMGSGIAQISAASGFNVTLTDVRPEALSNAKTTIEKSLKRIAKKQSSAVSSPTAQSDFIALTMERIKTSDNVSSAVADADIIIEAVVENIELKRGIFAQIEQSARKDAILATNTSSFRLEDIVQGISDKTRFGGLHFFNPVPVMNLLEVVRFSETSDATFATLIKFGNAVGKKTVACKDSPGFIVNRLLVPYMFEAIRLYEREDASMKDIDTAMKLGTGYPMGPFELLDQIGLDVAKNIMDGWHTRYPDDAAFNPCPLLDKLVAEGKLGKKTGGGFYSYKK